MLSNSKDGQLEGIPGEESGSNQPTAARAVQLGSEETAILQPYAKRDTILQKCWEDKAVCPLCRIEYHRPYLRTHLVGRHRLEESEAERLLCGVCVNK